MFEFINPPRLTPDEARRRALELGVDPYNTANGPSRRELGDTVDFEFPEGTSEVITLCESPE